MRISLAMFAAVIGLSVAASSTDAVEPREPISESLTSLHGVYPVFASLRIGPHWDGPEAATLKQVATAHALFLTSAVEPTAKLYDVKVGQVEELSVAYLPQVGLLTIATLIDEKAADAFDAAMPCDGMGTIAGRTFATSSKVDYAKQRIHPRVIQFGPSPGIRQLYGSKLPLVEKPIVAAFLAAAEKANVLTVEISPEMIKGSVPIEGTKFAPLIEAKRLRITAHADKTLRVTLQGEFADEAAAKASVDALKACLEELDKVFNLAEKAIPEAMTRDAEQFPQGPAVVHVTERAFQDARKALKESKPTASGNVAEAVVEVKTDRPVTTATILFSMIPRPQKEPAEKVENNK